MLFLHANGYSCDGHWFAYAAERGHVHVIEWAMLKGRYVRLSLYPLVWSAAKTGQLAVLRLVRANATVFQEFDSVAAFDHAMLDAACLIAAKYGHIAVVEWARSVGYRYDDALWARAAENGQIGMLAWALRQGCHWDCDASISKATSNGHLALAEWALSNRPCDADPIIII